MLRTCEHPLYPHVRVALDNCSRRCSNPYIHVGDRQAPNLKKGYRKVALFYCVKQSSDRFLSRNTAALFQIELSVQISAGNQTHGKHAKNGSPLIVRGTSIPGVASCFAIHGGSPLGRD